MTMSNETTTAMPDAYGRQFFMAWQLIFAVCSRIPPISAFVRIANIMRMRAQLDGLAMTSVNAAIVLPVVLVRPMRDDNIFVMFATQAFFDMIHGVAWLVWSVRALLIYATCVRSAHLCSVQTWRKRNGAPRRLHLDAAHSRVALRRTGAS